MLKQFQLLIWSMYFFLFFPDKQFHIPKLFIGDTENSYLASGRKEAFNSFDMHIGVFPTGTVPQVNRKLKHSEPILNQFFAKIRINFPIFLCFSW